MTALIIVGAILGYLAMAAATMRGTYLITGYKEGDLVMTGILWPAVVVVGVFWGLHRLATAPTKQERLEARRDRLQDRISQLEKDLEIPGGDS